MKKKEASGARLAGRGGHGQGPATTVEVPNAGSLGDAALAAEIQSRLLAAGLEAVVTVHGDEIKVEKRHP
jgi:hypothetical protein